MGFKTYIVQRAETTDIEVRRVGTTNTKMQRAEITNTEVWRVGITDTEMQKIEITDTEVWRAGTTNSTSNVPTANNNSPERIVENFHKEWKTEMKEITHDNNSKESKGNGK